MRGSLELSLNALVMFIISIIVLGFGIWLVNVFLDTGLEVVQAPDRCERELARQSNVAFAICPTAIPSSEWTSTRSYQIRYAITNTRSDTESFGVKIEGGSDFEILASEVIDVPRGSTRQGVTSIRLDPDKSVEGVQRVVLEACALDATGDPDCDELATRTLTINS